MNQIAEKIKAYNSGRLPEILKLKYKAMRDDRYRFYRAIPHLLYNDIPKKSFLHDSPNVWLCGDLHLENLGSYKADNRLTYFGVNDFDECVLGPVLFDITRLLTSIYVSADNLELKPSEAHALCNVFTDSYFEKLAEGYIRELEPETTRGIMKKFLEKVQNRSRKEFIGEKTEKRKGKLKLKIDNGHTLSIPQSERKEVEKHFLQWAKTTENPDFYKVKDIAFRIAGTSSLGLRRYALLVEGRGKPDGFFLLDLKETLPSCLEKHCRVAQPNWKTEAERIVEVQRRTLSAPPALLASINIGKRNFVLKELQPSADRIDYVLFSGNTKKLKNILEDMAAICAWSNLRSTGRDGSAIADELIDFAKAGDKEVKKMLIEYSVLTLQNTYKYYKDYCEAYDKGFFKQTKK
ncbi:MAG TPA: DUF2252 family protein [Bacteroidia bacterium]|nr:DUF2252 family protein [Bacteroidia bacterium]